MSRKRTRAPEDERGDLRRQLEHAQGHVRQLQGALTRATLGTGRVVVCGELVGARRHLPAPQRCHSTWRPENRPAAPLDTFEQAKAAPEAERWHADDVNVTAVRSLYDRRGGAAMMGATVARPQYRRPLQARPCRSPPPPPAGNDRSVPPVSPRHQTRARS